jgi:type III pantothenate kinase
MLLVDIGNSRVKWARSRAGVLTPQQAAEHAGWQAADWRALLAEPGVLKVVAASVAGGEPVEQLRAAARAAGCEFERVTTSATAVGVRNAYPDAHLLGVDRWLALVAAHHLAQAPACVIDVGTAMTVDAITADGQHLGGYILPGPRLMVASLLRGTSDLAAHSAASTSDGEARFATNTRDAIERGAVVALASLADRSVDELEQLAGQSPVLLLTGGAAALVAPYLRTRPRLEPDLVLQGLARLAGPQA